MWAKAKLEVISKNLCPHGKKIKNKKIKCESDMPEWYDWIMTDFSDMTEIRILHCLHCVVVILHLISEGNQGLLQFLDEH